MPVIDTTLLVQVDRKRTGAQKFLAELLAEGEPLLVPMQVAIEYAAGRQDPGEAMRRLRDDFALVPVGPDVALAAAHLAQDAMRSGRFPNWGDIQVAATARHEGMAIVSNNARHFQGFGIPVRPHP